MAVKTWVWVVGASVALVVVAFLALIGAGAYALVRQVQVADADPFKADRAFTEARDRFPEQKPLVEFEDEGWDSPRYNHDQNTGDHPPLEHMQVLVYNAREQRLTRLSIPFWLLRLGKDRTRIKVSPNQGQLDLDRLDLTVQDLERHGPGLIVDHTDPEGTRVLIWVQ